MAPLTRSALKRIRQGDCEFVKNELLTPLVETNLPKNDENHRNDFELSNNSKHLYGVRGLINLGASCYINSVIQALMCTSPLRQYLLSENHKCTEDLESICQMCELLKIFKEYYSGNVMPPISLHRLLYMIWLEAPCLAGLAQQDAHEFYMTYIQLLHNSCIRSYGDWLYVFNTTTNSILCNCIIDQLYAGILQSNLTCLNCKKVSSKRETFYDITLELNAIEMENLYNCLENYVKHESLGESCKIFCTHCNTNQEFSKKLSLVVLPNVLNINLKRFIQKGSQHKKLRKHVMFPFELDMKSFINKYSGLNKDELYSLSAVISHEGSMNSGHYTAYVKSHDIWLLCDDHKIKTVHPDIVLGSEAYILVYQRKEYYNSQLL